MKARGGLFYLYSFFKIGAKCGSVVDATLQPLYHRKTHGTHCTGVWAGPRAGLDGCGKISAPPGFDPRTVHPVASRYTD